MSRAFLLVAFTVPLVLAAACSDDEDGTGTTTSIMGGSGGTGGSGTGATGGSEGGTGGGAPSCQGVIETATECSSCLEGICCEELAACGQDAACTACANGDGAQCANAGAAGVALNTCLGSFCPTECNSTPPPACDAPATAPSSGTCITVGGAVACNPVTGAPCDTAGGETCDWADGNGFSCFPPTNDAATCDACNTSSGPFCEVGNTCFAAQCYRYCCDDGDCGTGTCVKDIPNINPVVGICQTN